MVLIWIVFETKIPDSKHLWFTLTTSRSPSLPFLKKKLCKKSIKIAEKKKCLKKIVGPLESRSPKSRNICQDKFSALLSENNYIARLVNISNSQILDDLKKIIVRDGNNPASSSTQRAHGWAVTDFLLSLFSSFSTLNWPYRWNCDTDFNHWSRK